MATSPAQLRMIPDCFDDFVHLSLPTQCSANLHTARHSSAPCRTACSESASNPAGHRASEMPRSHRRWLPRSGTSEGSSSVRPVRNLLAGNCSRSILFQIFCNLAVFGLEIQRHPEPCSVDLVASPHVGTCSHVDHRFGAGQLDQLSVVVVLRSVEFGAVTCVRKTPILDTIRIAHGRFPFFCQISSDIANTPVESNHTAKYLFRCLPRRGGEPGSS